MENVTDNNNAVKTDNKNAVKFMTILKKIFNVRAVSVWLPIVVIAVVFLIVAYYLIFPSRGYFHADCTDTLVWAAASYESGHLFDPDCRYACLLPFGGSLLMQPFYGIFGFSMTTHLIGMFLFLLIFSAALLFMLKEMKWSLPWIAVMYTAVMLSVSVSEKLREIFWGHIIYYSLGVLFIFAGLFIYFKVCNTYENSRGTIRPYRNKRLIILTVILSVWFFLCATDKLMALTIFTVPVIGAIFLERFFDSETKIRDNLFYGVILLAVIISTVGGYIASAAAAGDIVGAYADGYSNYSNPDEWIDNLLKFPLSWFRLMGVEAHEGEPLMSFASVMNLIKILAAVLLVLIPFAALYMYPKIKDRFTRIIIIVHFISSMLIMMGFIFGALSSAEWRLSPIVCTSVMTVVVFGKWVFENMPLKRMGGLLVAPQICVCIITAVTICMMPHDYGRNEKFYAVAEFLEENGLDYGYATFWNANSVTAVSNGKVKVRCINDITPEYGGVSMNLYQSRKQWYTPEPDQELFFLLLTNWEYNTIQNMGYASPVYGKERWTFNCDDYVILVYDEDIL